MTLGTQSLAKSSLAYAKLTATPTDTAWSQVYNAGNLFACLTLTLKEPQEETHLLQNLGKELFNNLEAEFFTLEEKSQETIREAIEKSSKHIPDSVTLHFSLAYFKDTILYLFLKGQGKIIMKRGEKTGILLEKKTDDLSEEITTASGYVHNGDTVIITSHEFATTVSEKHLHEALQLDLPNDIAESLSVHMHQHPHGAQAAIIIAYHSAPTHHAEIKEETLEDIAEEKSPPMHHPHQQATYHINEPYHEGEASESIFSRLSHNVNRMVSALPLPFSSQRRHISMRMSHQKKLFLSVTVIIFVLLVVSILFTRQQQQTRQTAELFASIYDPALKKYDEGKALVTLNADASREDLLAAEKLLKDGQGKFLTGSEESQKITELLTKVQESLGGNGSLENALETTKATVDDNSLLAVEKTTTDGAGFSQNDTNVYYVTKTTAVAVKKTSGENDELVKNDDNWEQAVAIVPYQSNFYILDQKDGIIKFVPSGDSYSSSAYFSSNAPDLSKAVSMAIDSSIWILFSDGSIKKYTRGQQDTFSIKGLNKPFVNPTKIYTDPDITNVYILDKGNSRIVQLTNDGTFKKDYVASVIKNAKDFEVLESEEKIRILSGGEIWEFSLE